MCTIAFRSSAPAPAPAPRSKVGETTKEPTMMPLWCLKFLLVALPICSPWRTSVFQQIRSTKIFATQKSWQIRDDEYIINKQELPDESGLYMGGSNNLFDKKYDSEEDGTDDSSLAKLSLREISEAYQFSLAFLGDFAVQLGCPTPLDIDTNLENLLTGEQVYTLLQALNSLDALDSNAGYDSLSVSELASDMNVSPKKIVEICVGESVGLPYGLNTVLHVDIVDQIRRVAAYDKYSEDEEEDDIEEDDPEFMIDEDEINDEDDGEGDGNIFENLL